MHIAVHSIATACVSLLVLVAGLHAAKEQLPILTHCSIPLLCETKSSYSYPALNLTQLVIDVPTNTVLTSLCVGLHSEGNNLHRGLVCVENVHSSDPVWYFDFPGAVAEGHYQVEVFLRLQDPSNGAVQMRIDRANHYVSIRSKPTLPQSRVMVLTPVYGSLLAHGLEVNMVNSFGRSDQILPTVFPPDQHHVLLFNIRGVFKTLVDPTSTMLNTAGQDQEPGSWFIQLLPTRYRDAKAYTRREVEEFTRALMLDVPEVFIPAGFPQVELADQWYGFHNEVYLEVILTDDEIYDQRLFRTFFHDVDVRERVRIDRDENMNMLQRDAPQVQPVLAQEQAEVDKGMNMRLADERRVWKQSLDAYFQDKLRWMKSKGMLHVAANRNAAAGWSQAIGAGGQQQPATDEDAIRKLLASRPALFKQPSKKESPPFSAANTAATKPAAKTNRQVNDPNKIDLCIWSSSNMDGQKRIWLQQAESLSKDKFAFKFLLSQDPKLSSRGEVRAIDELRQDEASLYYHLQFLPHVEVLENLSNGFKIELEDMEHRVADEDITAAMVWDYNTTKLYQYVHRRFVQAKGKIEDITPPFCRTLYQTFLDSLLDQASGEARCDIVVYGNARGFTTDIFIVDVATALGIPSITELLNLYLEDDILPDVIIAPSLHSLRHSSIQSPMATKKRNFGFEPVGVVVSPSVDMQHFDPAPYRTLDPKVPILSCHIEGSDSNLRRNITLDEFHYSFYKHRPCVLIGFVARISAEKNPGLFLQAAYHILKQYPFARFRFIGQGVISDNLKALANRLKIAHAVEFLGWISSKELPAYLSDIDILVNPSLRGWSETFCISNIEAMSMEIPLVTFAVGGIGEYVIAPPSLSRGKASADEELPSWEVTHNAVVVHSADPEVFAEATLHLIQQPAVARRIGRNARLSLMNFFTVERQMQQYDTVYESIYQSNAVIRSA